MGKQLVIFEGSTAAISRFYQFTALFNESLERQLSPE